MSPNNQYYDDLISLKVLKDDVNSINLTINVMFVLQAAEVLIQNFLDKAKSLPVASMSEEEVKAELRKMKQELSAQNNTYISEILARCVTVKTA